jgi:hypothetical protein
MIPSEKTAEIAKALMSDENYDEESDTYRLPEGWSFCGAGAYRTCFLAPDGYVYKVQHATETDWQENQMEWEAYGLWAEEVSAITNGLIRLSKPVEFFTDSNVLVMEYEPCAGNAMWFGFGWDELYASDEVENAIKRIQSETDINDLHSGNVYFNTDAELVIVDYSF